MSKLNSLLFQRLKPNKDKGKMADLAKQTTEGKLSSFTGVFGVAELTESEKQNLQFLLQNFAHENQEIDSDLRSLSAITSEVKAITNQAAMLHGERIKRAQNILKNYKDGAFSAWLIATYGNRQTPYNFLQYFEFYAAMPKSLHPLIETMPRQAIYTLASREGDLDKKEEIVRTASGQSKQQLLVLIREAFPLPDQDKRKANAGQQALAMLYKLKLHLQRNAKHLSHLQKAALLEEMEKIQHIINHEIP